MRQRAPPGLLQITDSVREFASGPNVPGNHPVSSGEGEAPLREPDDDYDQFGNLIESTEGERERWRQQVEQKLACLASFFGGAVALHSQPRPSYPCGLTPEDDIRSQFEPRDRVSLVAESLGASSTIADKGDGGRSGNGGPVVKDEPDTPTPWRWMFREV